MIVFVHADNVLVQMVVTVPFKDMNKIKEVVAGVVGGTRGGKDEKNMLMPSCVKRYPVHNVRKRVVTNNRQSRTILKSPHIILYFLPCQPRDDVIQKMLIAAICHFFSLHVLCHEKESI